MYIFLGNSSFSIPKSCSVIISLLYSSLNFARFFADIITVPPKIIEKIETQIGRSISPKYIKKESSYVEDLQADTKLMNSILKINPISIDLGIKKFAEYLKIT